MLGMLFVASALLTLGLFFRCMNRSTGSETKGFLVLLSLAFGFVEKKGYTLHSHLGDDGLLLAVDDDAYDERGGVICQSAYTIGGRNQAISKPHLCAFDAGPLERLRPTTST